MTIYIVAELRARAGLEDRLRTALEAMIEPSLSEPGCISYQPFVDPNDATRMLIFEEWTDSAAIDFHFATPHFEHVGKVLAEILAEPLVIRRLVAEQ